MKLFGAPLLLMLLDMALIVAFVIFGWQPSFIKKLKATMRANWKRILIGVGVGWLVANILGAVGLVVLAEQGILMADEDSAALSAGLVLFAMALGGVLAHALRPHDA